jgi:DivIVA domain-containing protein
MSTTPHDLREARFERVRRGYDPAAVDDVLAAAADVIEALRARVRDLETEVERYHAVESTLSDTLALADRAAEELKAEARAEAEQMLAAARTVVGEARSTSALPDPAFLELLGETRAIRSLLQAVLTQSQGNGGSPFTPRPQ